MSFLSAACLLVPLLLSVTIWRRRRRRHGASKEAKKAMQKTLVTLGQGGHIREMYEILKSLGTSKYEFRFICDRDDYMTLNAFKPRFVGLINPTTQSHTAAQGEELFHKIPVPKTGRTSKLRAIITTLQAFLESILLLHSLQPDIILTNGPGIAVPLCYAALLMNWLCLQRIKIVYIESCCRVENLSYSGKLVYYIADGFVVLWPQLAAKYPRAHYLGDLDRL